MNIYSKRINPYFCYKNLGKKIKQFRLKLNLTQQDLGDLVGLTRTSIVNIEAGRQKILFHTLYDFAIALKINPKRLI